MAAGADASVGIDRAARRGLGVLVNADGGSAAVLTDAIAIALTGRKPGA